jgi:hypothetical protein
MRLFTAFGIYSLCKATIVSDTVRTTNDKMNKGAGTRLVAEPGRLLQ